MLVGAKRIGLYTGFGRFSILFYKLNFRISQGRCIIGRN